MLAAGLGGRTWVMLAHIAVFYSRGGAFTAPAGLFAVGADVCGVVFRAHGRVQAVGFVAGSAELYVHWLVNYIKEGDSAG